MSINTEFVLNFSKKKKNQSRIDTKTNEWHAMFAHNNYCIKINNIIFIG